MKNIKRTIAFLEQQDDVSDVTWADMDAKLMNQALIRAMEQLSRPDPERVGHLGMSQIGGCPLALYNAMLDEGTPSDDRLTWYGWTGDTHEAAIRDLLESQAWALRDWGIEKPLPHSAQGLIISHIDQRFRGHIDFAIGRTVIDVKSVYFDKFAHIWRNNAPPPEHLAQLQMYMDHGGFERGILVYVARDIPHRQWDYLDLMGPAKDHFGAFFALDVPKDEVEIARLNDKARAILVAFDRQEPPGCECGYCAD